MRKSSCIKCHLFRTVNAEQSNLFRHSCLLRLNQYLHFAKYFLWLGKASHSLLSVSVRVRRANPHRATHTHTVNGSTNWTLAIINQKPILCHHTVVCEIKMTLFMLKLLLFPVYCSSVHTLSSKKKKNRTQPSSGWERDTLSRRYPGVMPG